MSGLLSDTEPLVFRTAAAVLTLRCSVIAALLCLSCKLPSSNTVVPAPSAQGLGASELPVGPGDVLEVRVFQEADLTGVYTVSGEGFIGFPLCGKVPVASKTPGAAADEISKCLANGFLKRPRVTVELKQFNSMQVFVFGEVTKPGAYTYSPGMTIVHAVSLAGGLARTAAKNSLNVTRVVEGKEVKLPVKMEDIVVGRAKNVELVPGDIIFVPESFL
jgi:protein involved in polysaccharide export with SLBB domain